MIGNKPKKEKHKRIAPEDVHIEDWLPLVYKIVNNFQRRHGRIIKDNKGDFISAGCIGLYKAKEKYDPLRGTYATLAFLRVMSAVQTRLDQMMRYYQRYISLEDTLFPNAVAYDVHWTDVVEGVNLDYEWIGHMIPDKLEKLVYFSLLMGFGIYEIKELTGESMIVVRATMVQVREQSLAIVRDLYGPGLN